MNSNAGYWNYWEDPDPYGLDEPEDEDEPPMTSNERLAQIQADLLQPDVSPQIARKHLVTLTALWGDFKTAATEADIAFCHVYGACRAAHDSAKDAEIAAKATTEYAAMRRAKDDEAFCLELIRSCKAAMKSIDEEMRMAR